jgi:hypothetical protein
VTADEKKPKKQSVTGIQAEQVDELLARYEAGEVDAVMAELLRRLKLQAVKARLRKELAAA